MEIFLDVLKNKYAKFDGRARRNEFWMFYLFSILIYLATYAVVIIGAVMESSALSLIGMVLYVIAALALLIPGLAVTVRRLHDVNRSGWSYLFILIPLVGPIMLLVWWCTEGNRFTNNYGPDPKGGGEISEIGKSELV